MTILPGGKSAPILFHQVWAYNPDFTLSTDSTKTGWGGSLSSGDSFFGHWSVSESNVHFNFSSNLKSPRQHKSVFPLFYNFVPLTIMQSYWNLSTFFIKNVLHFMKKHYVHWKNNQIYEKKQQVLAVFFHPRGFFQKKNVFFNLKQIVFFSAYH